MDTFGNPKTDMNINTYMVLVQVPVPSLSLLEHNIGNNHTETDG